MDEILKKTIIEIWNDHISSNQFALDGDGNAVNNIDDSRLEAIQVIKVIIRDFINDEINLVEFKSALDVFNRHNNLWNFSAKMGQMYFNLLLKTNEDNFDKLSDLLKNVISEPKDLKDALKKIEDLEKFTNAIFLNAEDKRKVPYPGSVGYFLSYFWQVHNPNKWPIIYSSLINGFREIGIWKDQTTQKASYNFFYSLNEELKALLKAASNREISNWDIEHAFWNFKFAKNPFHTESIEVPAQSDSKAVSAASRAVEPKTADVKTEEVKVSPRTETSSLENTSTTVPSTTDFDLTDYIIPKVARLLNINEGSSDLSQYETLTAEAFKQMDFEVTAIPRGPRKNPYAILKFREENTAILLDIRFNGVEYFNTTDDRALKESIKDHCEELRKEGYKKTLFVLVSDHFENNYEPFINYISWHTDIKKMLLMTTGAVLHLLAFKNKDKVKLEVIVDHMAGFGNLVTTDTIVRLFEPAGN